MFDLKPVDAVRPLLFLSVVFYAACLTQTAFCHFNDRMTCEAGFAALLFGAVLWPAEINTGGEYGFFTWWANVLLFMGWAALWFRSARWAGLLWCAASMAVAPWHLRVEFHSNGWTGGRIVSHDLGFWLWLGSMGVALVASLLLPRRDLLQPGMQLFFPWRRSKP